MIKKIILSLTFILLIFTGCATVTPTGGAFTDSVVETSKSRLIIFRGGGSLLAKEIPAVNIFGAQPSIYNLPSNSFIQEDLLIYTADITEVDEAYALGNLNSLNRVLNTDTAN